MFINSKEIERIQLTVTYSAVKTLLQRKLSCRAPNTLTSTYLKIMERKEENLKNIPIARDDVRKDGAIH